MNFGDSNQVELSENKEFKNFVEQSKQRIKKADGGIVELLRL